DVSAIDVERGERCREVGFERQLGGELRRLFLEGRPRLLELRLRGDLSERRPLTGQLLVQAREKLLAGGIDEEGRDVVQELVAGRSLDRPLRAQALARLENLLD